MAKKGATSSHTLEAKSGALRHNRREVELSNVKPELSHLNESWESPIIMPKEQGGEGKTIDKLKHERAAHYFMMNGRSAPGYGPKGKSVPPDRRTAFIRESCVVIKSDTTLADVRRFADSVCSAFGVKCLGIWIHKDEGYLRSEHIEEDGVTKDTKEEDKWKPNLHAHVLFDWYLPDQGRVARTTKDLYSTMQDMAAVALGMERGEPSERRHVASKDYAIEMANKRITKLKEIEALADTAINDKNREIDQQDVTLESKKKEVNTLNNLILKIQQQINTLNSELDDLKEKKTTNERSIKAQQTQLKTLIDKLKNAKDEELTQLEQKLNRKTEMLADAEKRLEAVNSQINDKTLEISNLHSQMEQCKSWISDFITEQDEIAEAWKASWDEFEYNTAGHPYNNRMEQLMVRHERLEAITAPLLKSLLEKAPELIRQEMRSLPVKDTASIGAFLANLYPAIAPLIWGSAPGVIGSEPRRKRKGDDDDEEYRGGYSR